MPLATCIADRRRGAVVDVDARVQRAEGELRLVARRGEGAGRAAARAGHGVQVDVVRHRVVGMVHQVQLDEVARRTRIIGPGTLPPKVQNVYCAPSAISATSSLHLDLHDDLRGVVAADRRRRLRRNAELRLDDRKLLWIDRSQRTRLGRGTLASRGGSLRAASVERSARGSGHGESDAGGSSERSKTDRPHESSDDAWKWRRILTQRANGGTANLGLRGRPISARNASAVSVSAPSPARPRGSASRSPVRRRGLDGLHVTSRAPAHLVEGQAGVDRLALVHQLVEVAVGEDAPVERVLDAPIACEVPADLGGAVVRQRVVPRGRRGQRVHLVEVAEQQLAGVVGGCMSMRYRRHLLAAVAGAHADHVALVGHHVVELVLAEEAAHRRVLLAVLLARLDRDRERRRVLELPARDRVRDARRAPGDQEEVDTDELREVEAGASPRSRRSRSRCGSGSCGRSRS